MMTEKDATQTKVNFWFAWVIVNAIGLAFAWPLGELIGRQVAQTLSWKFGQIVGIIVFEGFLWTSRGAVLWRTQSFHILKALDVLIWVTTEGVGWNVSKLPIQTDSPMAITAGAIFATTLGAMAWIVIWFIRIPKAGGKSWALKAFLWTLFGFIAASILISLIQTTSLVIAETLAKLHFPIIGMAAAGLVLGGLLGAITGLALVQIMRWQSQG